MNNLTEPSLLDALSELVDKQKEAIETQNKLISSLDKIIELQDLKIKHFLDKTLVLEETLKKVMEDLSEQDSGYE